MTAPTKLGAFVVALGLAFGAALVAGNAIGGGETNARTTAARDADAHGHGGGAAASAEAGHAGAAAAGLAVAADGYQLQADARRLASHAAATYRFRVVDAAGVTQRRQFELNHERRLHMIVVRRDMTAFQHVHPTMAPDGTWSVNLDLTQPGAYRVFADFMIGGTQRTLGTDLLVPGAFAPETDAAPQRAVAVAGRDVTIATSDVRAGVEGTLIFTVTRDGRAAELQPYLGAKGHLVALRDGDLAYLHVHPVEGGSSHVHADGTSSHEQHANQVAFAATFPTPGRYRLFLDVRTDGEVHTAPFAIDVPR